MRSMQNRSMNAEEQCAQRGRKIMKGTMKSQILRRAAHVLALSAMRPSAAIRDMNLNCATSIFITWHARADFTLEPMG